jgi:hypothetical protein
MGIMIYECKECGIKVQDTDMTFFENFNQELKDAKLCFNCHFWYEKIGVKDSDKVARINKVHYLIGVELDSPSFMKGHGGQKFVIKFKDGREVTTTNLWCQGGIPERFQDRLPDNAEFLVDPIGKVNKL